MSLSMWIQVIFVPLSRYCVTKQHNRELAAQELCVVLKGENPGEERGFYCDYLEGLGLITSESTLCSEAKALKILLEKYEAFAPNNFIIKIINTWKKQEKHKESK